ncbi:hypothetical protein DFA_01321 [Cavenderia fasciculata]|uniref:Peptidase S26 domain-containing protein n=1 Tax=Cavenderia fasciculata TaxID=261658 RepID=F4PS54_CACFS|nr:uncharacterized protein DFA_01321 [Cavenderia fasciculata]EGG21437.1 hypothetical protein DFA_01321 [Cavenderia fasciculata]|eukprot:XP_004359287.1 hypothetical protein DFA_01321 [Cavenderia fasciculata]
MLRQQLRLFQRIGSYSSSSSSYRSISSSLSSFNYYQTNENITTYRYYTANTSGQEDKLRIKDEQIKEDGQQQKEEDKQQQQKNKEEIEQEEYLGPMKILMQGSLALIQALGLAYLIHKYVVRRTYCVGRSMDPTLLDGDNVLVDMRKSAIDSVQVGDLVVIDTPTKAEFNSGKRVRFVGGDIVEFDHPSYGKRKVTIPKDFIWVEGDNAQASFDSRHYGPIPKHFIRGKLAYRVRFKEI